MRQVHLRLLRIQYSEIRIRVHVVGPLRDLGGESVLLQLGEAVRACRLRLGENYRAALADDGHLVHADFHHVDLIRTRVHVVEPWLEDFLEDALLARPRELALRRGLACERSYHARIADRDVDRVLHLDLVTLRVEAVRTWTQHAAPHALVIVVRRDDLAGREFLSGLGRYDADLAGGDGRGRHDRPVVVDRIQEVASLRERNALHALLARFCEDASGRKLLAGLRRHYRHLPFRHVHAACRPYETEYQNHDGDCRPCDNCDGIPHFAPPFPCCCTLVVFFLIGKPNISPGESPVTTSLTLGAAFS